MQIQLPDGSSCFFDRRDARLVRSKKWSISKMDGGLAYVKTNSSGECLMHRLILAPPDGFVVDHINGNGLDNRRENLRVVTWSENVQKRRAPGNNRCGRLGVQKTRHGTFCARITKDGITYRLGAYESAEEAAKRYDGAALVLYGKNAAVNFPLSNDKRRWAPQSRNPKLLSLSAS